MSQPVVILKGIEGSVSDWKRRRGRGGHKLELARVEETDFYVGPTVYRGVELTLRRADGKHMVVELPGAAAVEVLNALGSVLEYQGVL